MKNVVNQKTEISFRDSMDGLQIINKTKVIINNVILEIGYLNENFGFKPVNFLSICRNI